MDCILLICAVILLLCVASSKLLYKYGIPMLVVFVLLGILFGSEGFVGIEFSDYDITTKVCSVGLIFIMFYGGFSTNYNSAKPVIVSSVLLSTLGVILTALITGLFCYNFLGMTLIEGMLMGSIVSSTDAASVFAVLRSRKLNLNSRVASLLEIESGSNDPGAYFMTIILLTIMKSGHIDVTSIIFMAFLQVVIGIITGYVMIKFAATILQNVDFEINGLSMIFMVAIAVMSYSLSQLLGGNGYLSVYIAGIGLGNSKIYHKRSLVQFFDGISWLMQIMLFFTLGLLSFPSKIYGIYKQAIILLIFLLFIARPIVILIMLIGSKFSFKEKLFISFVGLRGASSIVFAIYALTFGVEIKYDVFHIVFFLALFSVMVQGTFIPIVAKKLSIIEKDDSIFRTFNDFSEEYTKYLGEIKVEKGCKYANRKIMHAKIPNDILIVMIKRNEKIIIPKGSTKIMEGDILIISSNSNIDRFM